MTSRIKQLAHHHARLLAYGALAFSLMLSPVAVYAAKSGVRVTKHLKDDASTRDMIKQKIAEDAFIKNGESVEKGKKRYDKYARKLAKMISKLPYAEQQAILNGS